MARMSAQVSSEVAEPAMAVPQTVTPLRVAAATSTAAFPIPVVTSSRSRGSRSSTVAGSGVRSRITITASNGCRRRTVSSSPSVWSWKKSTSARPSSTDQSVAGPAARW